jgi:hypothetical protein
VAHVLLVALGLSYIVTLAVRRLRGVRNRDPKTDRHESWQLIGLFCMGASLSDVMSAPIIVVCVLIGVLVGGMLLTVAAYLLAWKP